MQTSISLALGTVQLGMEYGIANSGGRPSSRVASAILSTAAALGVHWLDTARAYGEAETVIGAWMADREPANKPAIVTKIAPLGPDDGDAVIQLEASMAASLAALRSGRVDIVMLHRPRDMMRPGVHARLIALREAGVCARIGVSVYDPDELEAILDDVAIDAVQYPANLLDRRFALSGLPEKLRDRNVMSFVRSAYLQGLLAVPAGQSPSGFAAIAPVLERLDAIAAAHGVSRQSLLLGFTAWDTGADHLVVGAEQEAQLRQTVRAARQAQDLPARVWTELTSLGEGLPEWLSDPRQWQARRSPA